MAVNLVSCDPAATVQSAPRRVDRVWQRAQEVQMAEGERERERLH